MSTQTIITQIIIIHLDTVKISRSLKRSLCFKTRLGGGPRVVVSTVAFHARVRGSVPGLGGLKETKNVSSPSTLHCPP